MGKPDKLTNVLLILRKRDCQRHFAVNRGIGGKQSPRRVIKMELTFQFGGEALKLSRIRGHWLDKCRVAGGWWLVWIGFRQGFVGQVVGRVGGQGRVPSSEF